MRYTIIIPIYNTANKIGRALESVQKQSIKDLEIICINDGSEDNSAAIVQSYIAKDNRIKLYNQSNKGAAISRNFALDLAQGEYIAFLDADDAYDNSEGLEKIYEVASSNNAEICVARIHSYVNGQKKSVDRINNIIDQKDKFKFVDFQYDFYFPTYVYKKKFLDDNRIRFPIKKIYEDPIFLITAMTKASYIYSVDVDYYNYFWEKKEATMSLETVEVLLDGLLEVMKIAVENDYFILKDEVLERIDTIYYEEICQYANRPSILKKLIQINDYSDKEQFNIQVLKYLMEFGWSQELYLTKKLNKLRGLQVKDKSVVIYAAGGAGTECYKINKKYKEFKLVAWVDVKKAGKEIGNVCIKNVECINSIQFDKIIVAIRDDQLYDEIVTKLVGMGIALKKILRWK